MPKGKGRKPKNNQLVDEKCKKLQQFMDDFRGQCDEFEARLNAECEDTCTKIAKLYADKLKSLPEHIRNMTLTEYLAMQQQEIEETNPALQDLKATSAIRSQYEKSKFDSEKKKTLKRNKSERKRSLSVTTCSSKKFVPLPRISRVMSESCLSTPKNKQSCAPTFAITPKFNPRMPVVKALKRKPRAGEVVLSMSGSPLHNPSDEPSERHSVSVPLTSNNFSSLCYKISEDIGITKVENELQKKLDEETKLMLVKLKQKLDVLVGKK